MNDSISRRAAVDAIRAKDDYSNVAVAIGLGKAITAICELPSVQPQRWIPLSEMTPEPDERVVVTTGGYEYRVWDCMSNRDDDYFWEDEEGYYHNKYAVVAWMPLPEPWKGEEHEL